MKLLNIIKVTAFILIAFSLNISASLYSQKTKLSLAVSNQSIKEILFLIENQSEFRFIYESGKVDLEKSVSMHVKDQTVETILENLFKNEAVHYEITESNLILINPSGNKSYYYGAPESSQQKRTVTGTVIDQNGEPVIGANVVEKGTTNGTITDIGGNFALPVSGNAQLVISYIGYMTQEIAVGSQTTLAIALKEDSQSLDEVVVVGYGTARKSDLTGSIASLSGDRLNKQANPNLSAQLQGQMAGVQVMRSSGDQSSSGSIRVRGVTTMGTSDPLVIIDGIPGSLDDVTPSEVQNIQVLKDAASSAIYGSRAAAGVILVTTRKAKSNEFRMTYNFEYGINIPTEIPKYAGIEDYMTSLNELTYNDGGQKDLYGVYSQEEINSYRANHAADPDRYPMTDWQDLVINKQSDQQHHTFTLSGGTEKLLSRLSLDYFSGTSLTPGRKFERINARVNNEYKINNWITAKVDMSIRFNDRDIPADNPVYWTHYSQPTTAALWSNGLVAQGRDGENPYAKTYLSGTQKQRRFGFTGKIGIDLTPFEGLTISAVAAPTYYTYKNKDFNTKYNLYDVNGNIYPNNSTTNLREDRNESNNFTFQLYANYSKMFGRHSLNFMAGYEDYMNQWENLGAWRNNYLLSSYPYLNLGPADQQYNNGKAGHNAYSSYFGRIMYSWANRYMLQMNIRTDGSSRFAVGHRWGTFPSISAGWVISEENWMKDNGVFDFLKLRASIGQLGNERLVDSNNNPIEFPYMAALEFSNAYIGNKVTGISDPNQIAYQMTYAFESITWETTTTYGIGLDANFLQNRLRLIADWYYKKTEDMLLVMNFPKYVGYNAPHQNAGIMNTRGWDMELAWNDHAGDFNYGASFNISDYRSRMGYLGDLRKFDDNRITEAGSYFQEWYLYKSNGLFVNEASMLNPDGSKVPVMGNQGVGTIRFTDIDGDGNITGDKDRVRSGNSLPQMQYGGSLWASYKGFDFNLAFQGIGKWMKMIHTTTVRPLEWGWAQVPEVLIGNHWSPYNTDEQNAKMRFPKMSWGSQGQLYGAYDYWLYNAAYMRIKNMTLGYTIPQKITQKFKVNNLRLYLSANDLPAFHLGSGRIPGWDPEQAIDQDYLTTSYIFGVNLTF
ncbi:MAG: TonB-dependent receptor [Tannerellaceae bacterium]|jgi:TonB-linked SusC/RagA family outer membrane protein|nr:TonB-dependent receptor [Tannerellaceae bacterium]